MSKSTQSDVELAEAIRRIAPEIVRNELTQIATRERHAENDAAADTIEDPFADDEPVDGYFPRQIIDLKLLLEHYCELALKPKGRGLPQRELEFKLLVEMALAPKTRTQNDQRLFGLKSFVNRTPDQIFEAVGSDRRRGNPALKKLLEGRYIKQDRDNGRLSKRRHRAVYNPPWGPKVWAIVDRFEKQRAIGRAMGEEKKNLSPLYAANARMLLPHLYTIGRPILVLLTLNHVINGRGRSDHAACFLARLVGVKERRFYEIMVMLENADLIHRKSDELRPGTERNAPTTYTLNLSRERISAISSHIEPGSGQNADDEIADIFLGAGSGSGVMRDAAAAASSLTPVCPANEVARRPTEPGSTVTTQPAGKGALRRAERVTTVTPQPSTAVLGGDGGSGAGKGMPRTTSPRARTAAPANIASMGPPTAWEPPPWTDADITAYGMDMEVAA